MQLPGTLLLLAAAVLEVLETLMLCLAALAAVLKENKQNLAHQVFLVKGMLGGLQMALLVQQAVVVRELSELAQHQQVVEMAVRGLRVPSVER